MSTLVKFPSQVKPTRVSYEINRTDEFYQSPITGIQQVSGNGVAYWRWIFEYRDLSEDERDIVQSFLMSCKGMVNKFKVSDPAQYELKAGVSEYIDVFSGYGSFNTQDGSSSIVVNSWFDKGDGSGTFDHYVDPLDGTVAFAWRNAISTANLSWRGHGTQTHVNSCKPGASYVQRVKFFNNSKLVNAMTFQARQSSGTQYDMQSHPSTTVKSSDCLTAPLFNSQVSSDPAFAYQIQASIIDWTTANSVRVGEFWRYADYQFMRCALVSNNENLISYSHNFAANSWWGNNYNVTSGWSRDPVAGVSSGMWKYFANASVNTQHYIQETVTKATTEDIYTFSIYVQNADWPYLRIQMDGGASTDLAQASFNIASGTLVSASATGSYTRPYGRIIDIGSGFYKCSITAVTNSTNTIRPLIYFVNSDFNTAFTHDGSLGYYIYGAQLRKHPYAGHYIPTTSQTVVGTGWQTGSQLHVEGLDPGTVIEKGQRFEVVNRFNNPNSNYYERSEYKRLTKNCIVHKEGYAVLEFDPPIRNAPVTDRSWKQQAHRGETMHNPVIFHKPEMKVRLISGTVQYVEKPLQLTDITFEVIEDLSE